MAAATGRAMPDSVQQLAAELSRRCAADAPRYLLGIVGPPGSGKSTLATRLVEACPSAACVSMDGFHLSNAALDAAGMRGRKGAPETFDAEGFVSVLRRLRGGNEPVTVPIYDRRLHEPVREALTIQRQVRVVVVEGNYLLLGDGAWRGVRPLLDEAWYLDVPLDESLRRTRGRHIAGGATAQQADAKIAANDRPNALAIAATRPGADRVVALAE